MNLQPVANLLKKIGLYKPVRKIYNFIGRFNKQTEIEVNNISIKFWTPTFYLDNYIKNLAGEKELINELLKRINDKKIFWDIGANIGLYSIILSKNMNNNAKIFSFEPEQATYKLLQKNIALNETENITTFPFALGDINGEKVIYSSDTPSFGSHSFVQRTDYRLKKKGEKIEIKKADDIIENEKFEIPDIIKIDVEGAEILVLNGMKKLLTDPNLQIIMCEVHTNLLPLFNSSEDEVLQIFADNNFKLDFSIKRGNQNQYIFVR